MDLEPEIYKVNKNPNRTIRRPLKIFHDHTKNHKRRIILSYFLTYENIVSALSELVERCDMVQHWNNVRHKLQDMTNLMALASTRRTSVGGFAAAARQSGGESMPSDEGSERHLPGQRLVW